MQEGKKKDVPCEDERPEGESTRARRVSPGGDAASNAINTKVEWIVQ